MLAEIKRTTNQIADGIGMVGILCLALVLGMLSVVGAEDFLE
jgi:hypothetical protein